MTIDEAYERIARNFPARMSKMRKKRNLTKNQLAQILGCSYNAVNSWETGRRMPSAAAINALAATLGKEAFDILREDDR